MRSLRENCRAWKCQIMLILEENDIERFIKEEFVESEECEAKSKYKKDMIIAKRIIADSIKDNMIPQVSSMETLKEMFNSLLGLFEGRNINRKMNLRNQLKSVRAQKSDYAILLYKSSLNQESIRSHR